MAVPGAPIVPFVPFVRSASLASLASYVSYARSVSLVLLLPLALFASAGPASAQPLTVYDDALRNGFQDWSWAVHDLQSTGQVHSGAYAISMVPANWSGLYFHHAGFDAGEHGALELWVHGGASGGQELRFYLYSGLQPVANAELESFLPGGEIPAGVWSRAVISFAALGFEDGTIDGLVIQADAAGTQPTVYFDDLVLLETGGPPEPVLVTVDPAADRRPINPLVYGVNFGSAGEFGALPYPLRRWGGNAVTRYNWQKDATNRASDWFFINLPEGPDSTGLPDGSSADLWLDETFGAGAEAILTVPAIGWAARDRVKRWGFSVAKYGPQQETECSASGWPSWCEEDAGNGIRLDGTPVTGNDPDDTSVEIGPAFVVGWIEHLQMRFGSAQEGGVCYYALDNEPMLWNHTHRDVHPGPVDLDELWVRTQEYGEAVKAADPGAQVLGPAVWGWCAYFYSAADGCVPGPDMAAHGGLPLLEWYLARNRARELESGTRPVDIIDIHYYPQAPGVALNDDESVAALRLRSLKSLYDPSYVDESWIGQPVRLIPRMKEWIAARCPGMKLALTEYNWGGDDGISSALAQAEALAIFGREGVDLATRWVAPAAGSKVLEAFRLYLDFDRAGGALDGESIHALSSDVDDVGAYAILRAGGSEAAVLLFNKATGVRTAQVAVASATDGLAEVYRFDASHDLQEIAPVSVVAGSVELDLPARSATLLLVPVAGAAFVRDPDLRHDGDIRGGGNADADRTAGWEITVGPNPFRESLAVHCRVPATGAPAAGAPAVLEVVDVTGRLIHSARLRAGAEGRLTYSWHGRSSSGVPVPSGIYLLRLRSGGQMAVRRVLRVRD